MKAYWARMTPKQRRVEIARRKTVSREKATNSGGERPLKVTFIGRPYRARRRVRHSVKSWVNASRRDRLKMLLTMALEELSR